MVEFPADPARKGWENVGGGLSLLRDKNLLIGIVFPWEAWYPEDGDGDADERSGVYSPHKGGMTPSGSFYSRLMAQVQAELHVSPAPGIWKLAVGETVTEFEERSTFEAFRRFETAERAAPAGMPVTMTFGGDCVLFRRSGC